MDSFHKANYTLWSPTSRKEPKQICAETKTLRMGSRDVSTLKCKCPDSTRRQRDGRYLIGDPPMGTAFGPKLGKFGKHCATFFNSLPLWLLFVHHQQCCRAFTIPNAFFAACRSFQSTLTGLPNRGFHHLCSKFLRLVVRSFVRASKSFDHPLYALKGLVLLPVLSRCANNRKDVRFGDGVHSTPAKKECWN